jgi:hypothetical protein
MIVHGSRSTLGPGPFDSGQKMCFTPTKTLVCYIYGFIKLPPKHTVEAAEPPQSHFEPQYLWFRVRAWSGRSGPNHVDYWEGALQLLFNKLSLKMIDRGSRSTWGPGPSRFRLPTQKHNLPTLKQDWPTTVYQVFASLHSSGCRCTPDPV